MRKLKCTQIYEKDISFEFNLFGGIMRGNSSEEEIM